VEDGDLESTVKKARHHAGAQVPRSTYYKRPRTKHPKSVFK